MSQVAWETNIGWDLSFPANTDLSASGTQFKFVQLLSTGYITACTTAGQPALGVLQEGAAGTTGTPRACTVRLGGPTKIQCGGTFVAGDLVTTDSAGLCVKYTGATIFTGTPYLLSGSQVLGVALAAGASGSVSTINFNPQGPAAAGLVA